MNAMLRPDAGSAVSRASIESAYERIASKKSSEVFSVGDGHVLKMFREHVSTDKVMRESRICSLVNDAGLPSPAVDPDIVHVDDGCLGILLERAAGRPLKDLLRENPRRVVELAKVLARTHRQIHAYPSVDGLPSQQDRLAEDIIALRKLTLGVRRKLLRVLQSMPAGEERVCHTDLHPSNILMDHGSTTVIDWGGAVNGNPLSDVARTWSILRYSDARGSRLRMLKVHAYCMWFSSIYLRTYLAGQPVDRRELKRWMLLGTATRLLDNLPPHTAKHLVHTIERGVRTLA